MHRGKASASPPEALLAGMCAALGIDQTKSGGAVGGKWAEALSGFLATSANPHNDFLIADRIGSGLQFQILDVSSKVAEAAVMSDEPTETLQQRFSELADVTSLAALRFISAWMLFNVGQINECIEECDKCDQPFAHIMALQGQALLESGNPTEALPVLETAIKLVPHDPVPRFQAAKAALILEEYSKAWDDLSACWNMAPGTPEIAMLMGMVVARQASCDVGQVDHAWNALSPFMTDLATHDEAVACLIDIAARRSDKAGALEVIRTMDGSVLAQSGEFLKRVPKHLKAFSTLGWSDVAQAYLVAVTPPVKRS